jgi:hypothetical protein
MGFFTDTILTPVLALILWSLIVWVWMYATRIPAMQKAQINPQDAARTRTLNLPPNIMAISDNYNHLMEQPTIFYATAFYVYLSGAENTLNIVLAWAYVILRVIHSFIQNTGNIVMARFAVFSLSTLCLGAIAVQQLIELLTGVR